MARTIEKGGAYTFPLVHGIEVSTKASPVWFNGFRKPSQLAVSLSWGSVFYYACKLCGELVLNDRNSQQAHWHHHILMGDIALRKEK